MAVTSALALKHVKEAVELADAVPSTCLATLTTMESSGAVTATQAKTIVEAMIAGEHDSDPEAIAAALGYEAMDTSELEVDGRSGDRRPARRVGEVLRR